MMTETFLIVCLLIAVYHYVLYPGFVIVLARLRAAPKLTERQTEWPFVTLLICAYNEERVIEEKLRNSVALAYPRDRFEVIVVSDGSNDTTPDIVKSFSDQGVVGMHETARRGKTPALNRGIAAARGEIIVFSDANNEFSQTAIEQLVAHFADPVIGGVCGAKRIKPAVGRDSTIGDGLYWRYESALKMAEGQLGSIPTADGEIFAVRKSALLPLDETVINDDAEITFDLVRQGLRVIYEPEAASYELASISINDDFFVKVRMVAGGYQSLTRHWKMFFPPTSAFAVSFWSHKVLRWLMPWNLIAILLLSIASLGSPWVAPFLALQVMCYVLALIGWRSNNKSALPMALYLPFYFASMNAAAFFGLLRFLRRSQNVAWRKAAR